MSTNHDNPFAQTVSGTLQRPRYSPGLILEDSDLTAAIDYTRDLTRIMLRSLFGCGVVCGLTAGVDEKCGLTIKVQPGLAIDSCGDPIHVKDGVTIVIPDGKVDKTDYWIVARNKDRTCERRNVMCDDDDDAPSQPTRIRTCAEVSVLASLPKCNCGFAEGDDPTISWNSTRARLLIRDEDKTAIHAGICPTVCNCGGACGCDFVLLAWVHKYDGKTWGTIHRGVRRLIQPIFGPDLVKEFDPDPPADRGQQTTTA